MFAFFLAVSCNKERTDFSNLESSICNEESHSQLHSEIKIIRTPFYDTLKYAIIDQKEVVVETVNVNDRIRYFYDKDLLVRTESYKRLQIETLDAIHEYTYNDIGQVVRENYFVNKKGQSSGIDQELDLDNYSYRLYEYDFEGFPLKIDSYSSSLNQEMDKHDNSSEYDWENGNLRKAIHNFKDGRGKIEYLWEYDDKINPNCLQNFHDFSVNQFSKNNVTKTNITIYEDLNLEPDTTTEELVFERYYEYNNLDLPTTISYSHTDETSFYEYEIN